MKSLLEEVQEELISLIPESIDFNSQKDCIITEGYSVEDIAVLLLMLNTVNTERMAITFSYLYTHKLCREMEPGKRNIILDSSTGHIEINYRSRTNKEIEIVGNCESLKKILEDILAKGI